MIGFLATAAPVTSSGVVGVGVAFWEVGVTGPIGIKVECPLMTTGIEVGQGTTTTLVELPTQPGLSHGIVIVVVMDVLFVMPCPKQA